MPLALEVDRVLRNAVGVMRQGKAVHVAPQNLVLTTQEAADLFDVSRPTLLKLVEDGAIPFDLPTGIVACGSTTSSTTEHGDKPHSEPCSTS